MGVLVVGMHRSGTSAVAGALSAMGFDPGPESALMPSGPANPRGFFELKAVAELNGGVLDALGGSWDRPPATLADWAADPRLDPFLERADELVKASFGGRPFVLKDPRCALLLAMWRRILLDRFCAVLVVRRPEEVAWSLALRDGMQVATSYALWAHYYRSAIDGLVGLPVAVCVYEELLEQPARVLGDIAKSLDDWGEGVPGADVDRAAASIVRPTRTDTWRRDNSDLTHPPAEITHLYEVIAGQAGPHRVYTPPPLPEPAWWERVLLEERRASGAELRASARTIGKLRAQLAAAGAEAAAAHEALHDSEIRYEQAAETAARAEALAAGVDELEAQKGALLATIGDQQAELDRLRERWLRLESRWQVRAYRWLRRGGAAKPGAGTP